MRSLYGASQMVRSYTRYFMDTDQWDSIPDEDGERRFFVICCNPEMIDPSKRARRMWGLVRGSGRAGRGKGFARGRAGRVAGVDGRRGAHRTIHGLLQGLQGFLRDKVPGWSKKSFFLESRLEEKNFFARAPGSLGPPKASKPCKAPEVWRNATSLL